MTHHPVQVQQAIERALNPIHPTVGDLVTFGLALNVYNEIVHYLKDEYKAIQPPTHEV